ncbi:hypothetical protein M1146_03795 [Patescibacteria group bacterium]|nr:hypothetical protein [Patescibacteria group bacterium]
MKILPLDERRKKEEEGKALFFDQKREIQRKATQRILQIKPVEKEEEMKAMFYS